MTTTATTKTMVAAAALAHGPPERLTFSTLRHGRPPPGPAVMCSPEERERALVVRDELAIAGRYAIEVPEIYEVDELVLARGDWPGSFGGWFFSRVKDGASGRERARTWHRKLSSCLSNGLLLNLAISSRRCCWAFHQDSGASPPGGE
eukprot:tig00000492_g1406.t1